MEHQPNSKSSSHSVWHNPNSWYSVAKHNVPSSQSESPLCASAADAGCASWFWFSSSTTWCREPLRGRELHWHSRLSQPISSNAVGQITPHSGASAYVTRQLYCCESGRYVSHVQHRPDTRTLRHVRDVLTYNRYYEVHCGRETCVQWLVDMSHTTGTGGRFLAIRIAFLWHQRASMQMKQDTPPPPPHFQTRSIFHQI